MNIETIKENKLGTILQFSIPSIIAMLLSTLITITDGYFTGNYIGEEALAAINLGLPILYFYLGVGLCVGVGGSVICGRLLGAKENQKASEVFSQSIATAAIICVITSIAVYLLFTPILRILRADGVLVQYFTQYYKVMLMNYPWHHPGHVHTCGRQTPGVYACEHWKLYPQWGIGLRAGGRTGYGCSGKCLCIPCSTAYRRNHSVVLLLWCIP